MRRRECWSNRRPRARGVSHNALRSGAHEGEILPHSRRVSRLAAATSRQRRGLAGGLLQARRGHAEHHVARGGGPNPVLRLDRWRPYRRAVTWWVLSAKKEETRLKRAR